MSSEQYRRALDAAVREYEELGAKRREIDERLAQLAQTIGTLNRLCGFVSTVRWGLTDACRLVLKGAQRAMTPTDVRDRLAAMGFDLSRYANELAAIHTVLKRLHQAGEVDVVKRPAGTPGYAWRQPHGASPGPAFGSDSAPVSAGRRRVARGGKVRPRR